MVKGVPCKRGGADLRRQSIPASRDSPSFPNVGEATMGTASALLVFIAARISWAVFRLTGSLFRESTVNSVSSADADASSSTEVASGRLANSATNLAELSRRAVVKGFSGFVFVFVLFDLVLDPTFLVDFASNFT